MGLMDWFRAIKDRKGENDVGFGYGVKVVQWNGNWWRQARIWFSKRKTYEENM